MHSKCRRHKQGYAGKRTGLEPYPRNGGKRVLIYAIQAVEGGPIKLGFAAESVKDRLRALQTANYQELKILASDEGDMEAEKSIHRICRQERIRGEWFKPEGAVLYVLEAMRESRLQTFVTRCWAREIIMAGAPMEGEDRAKYWERRKACVEG